MDARISPGPQDFSELEGEMFTVSGAVAELEARLIEVKRMGTGLRDGGAFSLLWQGPDAPVFVQATYQVSHPSMGTLDTFLVPVARNDDGYCYEAVFA